MDNNWECLIGEPSSNTRLIYLLLFYFIIIHLRVYLGMDESITFPSPRYGLICKSYITKSSSSPKI